MAALVEYQVGSREPVVVARPHVAGDILAILDTPRVIVADTYVVPIELFSLRLILNRNCQSANAVELRQMFEIAVAARFGDSVDRAQRHPDSALELPTPYLRHFKPALFQPGSLQANHR